MHLDEVVARLRAAAGRALPGPEAQARMAPRPRRFWVPGVVPIDARAAAALALIYPKSDGLNVLLTVRNHRVATHRGQIALPGGGLDPGEDVETAALREANEEVGLARDVPTTRLTLTPLHIPVSGYVLHPVVATAATAPDFRPSEREVERIIEVPLDALAAGNLLRVERRERDGATIEIPYFALGSEDRLWGATAMVVAELLAVLGVDVDPWAERV